MSDDYNIRDIINKGMLKVLFQTVLSHHKEFPKGMEVFVKGVNPVDGSVIHPKDLFGKATSEGCIYDLNRKMVEMSIESFSRFYNIEKDILLYINIHESLVKEGDVTIQWLSQVAKTHGVPTEVIAFDITDYKHLSVEAVKDFIRDSRKSGFYISIDDIGKSYFNMDRILVYNPDIIKINQQYLDQLPLDSYRELLKKQISHLAHEMGIVVVVTGIENEEVLTDAFISGAQYFQGYYFDKPIEVSDGGLEDFLDMSEMYNRFKVYDEVIKVNEKRALMNKLVVVLNQISEISNQWSENTPDEAFAHLFYRFPFIQNAWAVNKEGIQVTQGKVNKEGFRKRNASIFKVYSEGHDYSNEEFYRIMSTGALDMWITKPYVSLLNNQLCMGTASYINSTEGNQYILCLEVNYNAFHKMSENKLLISDQ